MLRMAIRMRAEKILEIKNSRPLTMRIEILLRRRRRRDAWVTANAAKARQLHGRMAYIEACNEAEEIHLDAFDPSKFDADETPQARFHACVAVGQAHIGLGSSCLPGRSGNPRAWATTPTHTEFATRRRGEGMRCYQIANFPVSTCVRTCFLRPAIYQKPDTQPGKPKFAISICH
jgi:hypothetical protein